MSIGTRFKHAYQAFRFTTRENPYKVDGRWFFPLSGSMSLYDDLNYLKDFQEIPELNSVISRKARMFSKMRLRIVSKTTGQDVKNYEHLVKVLRNPNWYQAQREFLFQTKLFREIFGNEYLYFIKAYGLDFKVAKAMYTLPPYLTKSITPQDKPFFMYTGPVVKYQFKWGRDMVDLDETAVIQFNDNRVEMSKDNWVTGESKMESLKLAINNIRQAYQSRNIILKYRGAAGFISPDSRDAAGVMPFGDEEQRGMQDSFRKYGTNPGQFQFAFAPQPMKFVPVTGNDPNKLGLFTEIEADFNKVIDIYGLDRDMFGNEKGATFENKKQGERAAWNNTIIPEALEWADGLNEVYDTVQESWKIVADFIDIPVLQENIAEKGAALKAIADTLTLALNARACSPEDFQRELNKLGLELTDLPGEPAGGKS